MSTVRIYKVAELLNAPSQEVMDLLKKEAGIEVQGMVEESSGSMYRVKIDQGPVVLAYPSGKMKKFRIKIVTGDRVKVELSPYDLSRGRITYRDR